MSGGEIEMKAGDDVEVMSSHKIGTVDEARLDVAVNFLALHQHEYGSYTDAEARVVLRKIDWIMLPMMFVTSTICALDKNLLSNAALYGLKQSTHLVGQQYSWIGSILYIGFAIGEVPAQYLILKLPVAKLLAATTICFAALTMLMSACQNAGGLMAVRFLMGLFEAFIVPCLYIVTAMWWRRSEQPIRLALWYSQLASIFTGFISYGIGRTQTTIASWRLLFIVLGGFTFLWGFVILAWFPDSPLTARFLTDRQKYIAVHRTRDNKTGLENKVFKWYQVKEALSDLRTWALFVYVLTCVFANGGLTVFSAQIVSSLGFDRLQTVLLGMPTGVMMSVSAVLVAWPSLHFENVRIKLSVLFSLSPLIGTLCVKYLPESNVIGRLMSYYFIYVYYAAFPAGQ
ncbi:hypothetical protein KJ359_005231 [Pestalotiopsis sp. 9143b]|nr:hypothetical protein KJ359_005231 [Pestalotiopsis sp. 9143b]